MKYAIVGSRTFNDYKLLEKILDNIIKSDDCIVSGGANGADKLAAKYARERNLELIEIFPDWSIGKHAGPLRNQDIVNKCDKLIAFWDGQSKGTKNSIDLAQKSGKLLRIIGTCDYMKTVGDITA